MSDVPSKNIVPLHTRSGDVGLLSAPFATAVCFFMLACNAGLDLEQEEGEIHRGARTGRQISALVAADPAFERLSCSNLRIVDSSSTLEGDVIVFEGSPASPSELARRGQSFIVHLPENGPPQRLLRADISCMRDGISIEFSSEDLVDLDIDPRAVFLFFDSASTGDRLRACAGFISGRITEVANSRPCAESSLTVRTDVSSADGAICGASVNLYLALGEIKVPIAAGLTTSTLSAPADPGPRELLLLASTDDRQAVLDREELLVEECPVWEGFDARDSSDIASDSNDHTDSARYPATCASAANLEFCSSGVGHLTVAYYGDTDWIGAGFRITLADSSAPLATWSSAEAANGLLAGGVTASDAFGIGTREVYVDLLPTSLLNPAPLPRESWLELSLSEARGTDALALVVRMNRIRVAAGNLVEETEAVDIVLAPLGW